MEFEFYDRTKNLLRKWSSTGLLDNLDENRKEYLVNLLEDIMINLSKNTYINNNYSSISSITTYMFPIARKLVDNSIKVEADYLIKHFSSWFLKKVPNYKNSIYMNWLDFEIELINLYVKEFIKIIELF